jgi:hypothetical protein
VALELAEDRRDRVRGEGDPAVGIETIDGLHEPEVRDLAEIVKRLAGVSVLDGERASERHVLLDQAVSCCMVAGSGANPQLPHRTQ